MSDELGAVRLRVGSNVRQLRVERGWSQAALAEAAGQSEKQIQRVERGKANIAINALTRIAKGLGVEVWELLVPRGAERMARFTISSQQKKRVDRAIRTLTDVMQLRVRGAERATVAREPRNSARRRSHLRRQP